jgi:hypothetical protein
VQDEHLQVAVFEQPGESPVAAAAVVAAMVVFVVRQAGEAALAAFGVLMRLMMRFMMIVRFVSVSQIMSSPFVTDIT